MDILIKTLVFIGIYLSLTALFEHFKIGALVWPKYILDPSVGFQFGRARGPFVESAVMGRTLVITFLSILLVITQTNGISKWIYYLFAVISVMAIYFTYTRGPWIGLGLALLVFARDHQLRRPAGIIILVILILYVSDASAKFSLSGGTLFSKRQETVTGRQIVMSTTINMIKHNPLVGIGFGKFNSEWSRYYDDRNDDVFGGFDGNHNTFLGVFAETGILGFGLYMYIFYFAIRECLGAYRKALTNAVREKKFILLSFAVLICYLVSAQTVDSRYNSQLNSILFAMLGLVSSMALQARESQVELEPTNFDAPQPEY